MASDYERITEWEQATGATFARFRREEGFWDDVPDLPF
jgi:hypothetical protein